MLQIGKFNELVVQRQVDFGVYLNPKPEEVLLPAKYVPPGTRPGDRITVFVYTYSEDRVIATTRNPKAVVGDFVFLAVTDTAPFGAFMDWGLEKDLLVPNREQPVRMVPGRSYVIRVCMDERTNRVFGSGRIADHCDRHPQDLAIGDQVQALVYGISRIGIQAVVNNRYCGMFFRDQICIFPSIGEKIIAYVRHIREDGKIDLIGKPPGRRSISKSASRILEELNRRGGFVACHDKTPPEEIVRIFSMSKKEFKRAAGGLYKSGDIDITDQGIRIRKNEKDQGTRRSKP